MGRENAVDRLLVKTAMCLDRVLAEHANHEESVVMML